MNQPTTRVRRLKVCSEIWKFSGVRLIRGRRGVEILVNASFTSRCAQIQAFGRSAQLWRSHLLLASCYNIRVAFCYNMTLLQCRGPQPFSGRVRCTFARQRFANPKGLAPRVSNGWPFGAQRPCLGHTTLSAVASSRSAAEDNELCGGR